MALKPYELNPGLFSQIEEHYSKFSHAELIKVNFLVQVILEAGCDAEVVAENNELFIKIHGRIDKIPQRVEKITALGYTIDQGRIKIK